MDGVKVDNSPKIAQEYIFTTELFDRIAQECIFITELFDLCLRYPKDVGYPTIKNRKT